MIILFIEEKKVSGEVWVSSNDPRVLQGLRSALPEICSDAHLTITLLKHEGFEYVGVFWVIFNTYLNHPEWRIVTLGKTSKGEPYSSFVTSFISDLV